MMLDLNSDTIVLRFAGGEISPDIVQLQEIADKVTSVERLLEPILAQDSQSVKWEKTFIGLEKVEPGSIVFQFKLKQHSAIVLASLITLTDAIRNENIDSLPQKTVNEIEKISKFNSKYNCEAELGAGTGPNTMTLAKFGKQFSPENIEKVKGYTTVYGWIKWLGGDEDKPKIELVLHDGEKLNVEVREEDLSNYRAHSYIGVSGNGVWKGKDLKLVSLEAKEIFVYEKKPINEAFADLRESFKNYPLQSFDNT